MRWLVQITLGVLLIDVLHTSADCSEWKVAATYVAEGRRLDISVDGVSRYRYTFNKGGAINGIFDLKITPEANLIGESFQGETTGRVIQWTYWNSR